MAEYHQQKSEVAVTHSLNLNTTKFDDIKTLGKVTWLIPLSASRNQKLKPWADELIKAVQDFSAFLLKSPVVQKYPEIIALGYWCRKANLQMMREEYQKLSANKKRQPQGNVFHIAPANVDTVFFYSLILSVLSGNKNIVRISERSGDICRALIRLLAEFLTKENTHVLQKSVAIVEYASAHTQATLALSQWCQLRVIWGGDIAIEAISQIAPGTPQLAFPDRYSIAVMQLKKKDQKELSFIAQRFIADFLPFNQQACSSPKAIYWLKTPEQLKKRFYLELKKILNKTTEVHEVSLQTNRIINIQTLLLKQTHSISYKLLEQDFSVIDLDEVTPAELNKHEGNFLLLTCDINQLNKLPNAKKLQTISYFGLNIHEVEQLKALRKTKLGSALAFNHYWDGVNLLAELTIQ